MSRLIDVDTLIAELMKHIWDDKKFSEIVKDVPTIHAIPVDKVKAVVEQLDEEREFAYADFEEYKVSVLGIEADELPDDEFRYGVERCMQLLNKLIAESEEV